jgi:hypothetical protein
MTLSHPLAALAVQAVFGLITGNWWAGAALGSAFYIGREATQAEYRWIERFGAGQRANMPWWAALDRRVWTKVDPWLDWVLPLIAVCAAATFFTLVTV